MTLPATIANHTLDDLARVVRDEIRKAHTAMANALAAAMDAGDALIAARPKVEERGILWTKWLRENCLIKESTAKLYIQLAQHRDEIEGRILDGIILSLRAARRLIAKPAKTGGGSGTTVPALESLVAHWKRDSAAARSAFLDAVGVEAILGAMSEEFGRRLRARVPASKGAADKPFKTTLNLTANSAPERGTSSRH
jgi:hypothetical protein